MRPGWLEHLFFSYGSAYAQAANIMTKSLTDGRIAYSDLHAFAITISSHCQRIMQRRNPGPFCILPSIYRSSSYPLHQQLQTKQSITIPQAGEAVMARHAVLVYIFTPMTTKTTFLKRTMQRQLSLCSQEMKLRKASGLRLWTWPSIRASSGKEQSLMRLRGSGKLLTLIV
jgi:hypothetical protein